MALFTKTTFNRRASEFAAEARKEARVASHIPYETHWDHRTIITKDEKLLQIIKLQGFAFETADDQDVDIQKHIRNSMLKGLSNGRFALWFHTLRRYQPVDLDGEFPPGFAWYVNEKWRTKHQSKDSFVNDLYITVIRQKDTKGSAKIENAFTGIAKKADKRSYEEAIKEEAKELYEAVSQITATLKNYRPRVLSVIKTKNGMFSEPLEFLGQLVNCGAAQPMLVPSLTIDRYIGTHRLYFGSRAIEVRGPTKRWFAGIMSLKDYRPETAAGMLDSFLELPFEFILTQSYDFINPQTAIEKLNIQQKQMITSSDVAISQVAEISDALDLAVSGHVGFGNHHLTLMAFADSLEQVEENLSQASAKLIQIGITPVREKLNMEACYWAQLPANRDYIARSAIINSLNVAGLAALHNYPTGRPRGNHWGPAVTAFNTSSGTTYFFNFHLNDVGHTTIIGPTGAGKTVLMNFLCTQAQKFRCRIFLFDKDRGAEIFVRALGGKYSIIRPSPECRFNPLLLPDTTENRSFLLEWLRALVTTNDEPINSQDEERMAEAIAGNYKLAQEDRRLANIAPFLGLQEPGSIGARLKMWYGDGSYSDLFDNHIDVVDFDQSSLFGFEMGEVLQSPVTLGPVLLYIFHRIKLSLDGTPTMVVLDEAWALIDNHIFGPKIRDWLKTMRKLNAMVVFATQSVEDASKSAISDTLIQQTATQIFLPNPKATEVYKEVFMVSDREFDLLKHTDPSSRFFLVKQGRDLVVARLELGGMDDIITILSGRSETVAILDEIRNDLGADGGADDPSVWIPMFLERVKQMELEIMRKESIEKERE